MTLEFSQTSFQTDVLGLQYWEYKMLGDAELYFDETKKNLYNDIYCKFIKHTLYPGFPKESDNC